MQKGYASWVTLLHLNSRPELLCTADTVNFDYLTGSEYTTHIHSCVTYENKMLMDSSYSHEKLLFL